MKINWLKMNQHNRQYTWSIIPTKDDKYIKTLTDDVETQLFWYDFWRYIYWPAFCNQNLITVSNVAPDIIKTENGFDQHRPVYIMNDNELLLPDSMENVFNAQPITLPKLQHKFSLLITFIISSIVYFIIVTLIIVLQLFIIKKT